MDKAIEKLLKERVIATWRSTCAKLSKYIDKNELESTYKLAFTLLASNPDSLLVSHLIGLNDISFRISSIEVANVQYGDLPKEFVDILPEDNDSVYYIKSYSDESNLENLEIVAMFNSLIESIERFPKSRSAILLRPLKEFRNRLSLNEDIESEFTSLYEEAVDNKMNHPILSKLFDIKILLIKRRKEPKIDTIINNSGLVEAAISKFNLIKSRIRELQL